MGYNKYGGFSKSSIRRGRKAFKITTNIIFGLTKAVVKGLNNNNVRKVSSGTTRVKHSVSTKLMTSKSSQNFIDFMKVSLNSVSNTKFDIYKNQLSNIIRSNLDKKQKIKNLEQDILELVKKRNFWSWFIWLSDKKYKEYSVREIEYRDNIKRISTCIANEKLNIENLEFPQFDRFKNIISRIRKTSCFYMIFGIDKYLSVKPTVQEYASADWYDRRKIGDLESFEKIFINNNSSGFGCDRLRVIFYPAFIFVSSFNNYEYAILEYKEVKISYSEIRIRENISYSSKENVMSTIAWKYSRLDGNPDCRYKDNEQISIVTYANLTLENSLGLKVELITNDLLLAKDFIDHYNIYSSFTKKNISYCPTILNVL